MAGLFIDSNLLVLLTVGSVGRDLIAKHRRLREYTAEDYGILVDLLSRFDQVFVTPNTLTETSNLLEHAPDHGARSSVVEGAAHNRLVAGSNPAEPTFFDLMVLNSPRLLSYHPVKREEG